MRTEKEKYEDIMDTIQEYLDELYPDIYEKSIFKTKRNFYKSLCKAVARRLNLIVDIEVGDVMPERELKKAFDFQGDSLTLSVTSEGNLEPVEGVLEEQGNTK